MFKKFTILLACSIFILVGCAKGKDCNSMILRFDKDPNNLSGDVNVGVDRQSHDKGLFDIIVLLDEKKQGEFFLHAKDPCDSETYGAVMLKTQFFPNGPHTVTLMSKDSNLAIVCQTHTKVVFNNELSSVTMDKGYWFDDPFHFSAVSSLPLTNYIVEVNDSNGNKNLYSHNFTGNINAVIPPEVFAEDSQIYYLKVRDSSGNIKFDERVGRDYDQEVFEENGNGEQMKREK